MADAAPFSPGGATVNLSATNVAASVQFNLLRSDAVRLYNSGAEAVFIAFGDSTVTTTVAAGMPIGAGVTEVLGCGGQSYIAGITAGSGPAVLYVTPGEGV